MNLMERAVHEAFVAEFATVAGAVLEGASDVRPASQPPSEGWVARLDASQGAEGTLLLFVDRSGAEALTKRASGLETEPTRDDVVRTLGELVGDAVTSFSQHPTLGSGRLTIASITESATLDGASTSFDVVAGDAWTMRVAIAGSIVAGAAAADRHNPTLDVLLDIDLPLVVRFGRTEMTLKALTALGPGSVIDLGRSPDERVEVLVSNQLVAHGEVVIVGGSYGVRITDVRTAAERARSLEGRLR
jgi:flagellar motor switch protein FliN